MEEIFQEYPKMLYLHPVDKTKDHKVLIVKTPDEQNNAFSKGYKQEPNVPVTPASEQYEGISYEVPEEAQGSGYTHGWDKGFAQDGDPYGIQAEYLLQSANPDDLLPTQAKADEIVAKAEAEQAQRDDEIASEIKDTPSV